MLSAGELAQTLGMAQREGRGWRCLCPSHADHAPSLSIVERDGQTLFVCRAGCAQDAVIAALRRRDLWSTETPVPGAAETIYDYRDEAGELRYQVVRRPVNGAGKKFVQRRPDGKGGCIWNMQGVAPLPYRLPELLAAGAGEVVFVAEGEKCVESIARLGLVASCNSGGAGKWRPELSTWFAARDVVVMPDHDEPGRSHAAAVARALAGIAARIRVLELPGLRPKGDVSDWLAAGGTRERLLALAATAPDWQPEPAVSGSGEAVDDEAEISRLAQLKPLAYEREREAAAELLGCRVVLLDRLVKLARGDNGPGGANGGAGAGKPVEFEPLEAWPNPVDGAELLDAIDAAIKRHVILDDASRHGAVLWVVFTHCFGISDFAPKLLIGSPQMRCGKTRLLRVLRSLVPRPLTLSNATPAALFRVIDEFCPVLLIDEADTFVRDDPELQGLLNSGFDRGDGFLRNVAIGDGWEPRLFVPWCPQAIAGIGNLHNTTEDRGLRILMKRKLRTETVEPLRADDAGPLRMLALQAARWNRDQRSALAAVLAGRPSTPAAINDRAADAWSICLAIADTAGGRWPDLARAAAVSLSGDDDDAETSRPVMLLADVRAAFAARQGKVDDDRISSADLVSYLLGLDDRPWAEMGRARRPLTENMIARLLKTFRDRGLKPHQIRFGDGMTRKGYYQTAFRDAFTRWLPSTEAPF